MASKAASVPLEHEVLCEHCGYGLDGLPPSGLCPECGKPIADSTTDDRRIDPPWELPGPLISRFCRTTIQVIASPTHFFRHIRTRTSASGSRVFALLHHWLAGYFFAIAAVTHVLTMIYSTNNWDAAMLLFGTLGLATMVTPITFAAILLVRVVAGKLSVLEARYHGMRLPDVAVTRALHYHAAHLLPVAFVTALLPGIYRAMLFWGAIPRSSSEIPYLYILSGWVVVAAGYLFVTYWAGMKAIMYANR